ncbi:MAG: DUF2309 family protein [Leptospira sp.]|nr:DUF2309 family protein [Leptospira sp.]
MTVNKISLEANSLDKNMILKSMEKVPPLWGLDAYIAVNPFMGYTDDSFINSLTYLESVLKEELIPNENLLSGKPIKASNVKNSKIHKLEALLGGFLASYSDQGISFWPNPWKDLDLWNAFLQWSNKDPLMNSLLDDSGKEALKSLSTQAIESIIAMAKKHGQLNEKKLEKLLFLMPGWASYFRKSTWLEDFEENSDLPSYLAILCFLDIYINEVTSIENDSRKLTDIKQRFENLQFHENEYRSKLLAKLKEKKENPNSKISRKVRFLFCIDVRSEPMRRYLEAQSDLIETDGFAGFFGMPISWKYWTNENLSHSPAIIKPPLAFKDSHNMTVTKKMSTVKNWIQKIKRTFPVGFHYVESAGFLSSLGLSAKSLGIVKNNQFSRKVLDRDIEKSIDTIGKEAAVDVAEGILNHLSWKDHFPDYIIITGHGSHTYNNPHEAGLSCGACSGQTGELSSRFFCILMNREDVREGLSLKGIHIPKETKFIPAIHETVTDKIQVLKENDLDEDFKKDLNTWIDNAQREYQLEKQAKLGLDPKTAIRRSKDWAEVFPEAGLAGCASIIVAKNIRTRDCNLEGRSFLNSYDWKNDKDCKTLELLLTAPVVVASWINLQYFASTVTPSLFGAGNKLIHSIVGNFGVFEGNSWDLKAGLPLQSVHDGIKFIHQPIRLQAIVEAPIEYIEKVLAGNQGISQLVDGEWIHLIAWDPDFGFQIRLNKKWSKI